MIRHHLGRLFWKFFFVTLIVQISSDVMIDALHSYSATLLSATGMTGVTSTLPSAFSGLTQHHWKLTFPPLTQFLDDLLASLGCATILAWLLSKPIRKLHAALSDLASGNLGIRIADRMGPGNDELKDLSIEFDRMIGKVQDSVSAQRRLLIDVSHEIRSPMARIQAAAGLAHQQPDQVPAMLERIERESIRVDRLVGELLALSRLESGLDHSMCEEVDVHALLSDIVDDARFEANLKGRTICMGAEVDGTVEGNIRLLRRAIENVVRNAIKYSHRGGRVTLETALGDQGRSIQIVVQDTGSGVPEEDLAKIFDPFFRSPAHQRKEGSGMGLEIARRVVQTHGGSIRAANVPTGGLRVVIELPLLSEVGP